MKKPALSTREYAISLIDMELKRLTHARNILNGDGGNVMAENHNPRRRRTMSAESRRRISLAQKRRWRVRKAA